MNKIDVVTRILKQYVIVQPCKWRGQAFAPANIALCKYWGKRDPVLNLPTTASLSVTLQRYGAHCIISCNKAAQDEVLLNDQPMKLTSGFGQRVTNFLALFRSAAHYHFRVEFKLNIAFAAGLASSACSFAALVLALNDLFNWHLPSPALSILARLGSGSACRSIVTGFVEWHAGEDHDGMDSYAERLSYVWPELKMGFLLANTQPKALSSSVAMATTVASSPLYAAWPGKVIQDLTQIKTALAQRDFHLLGKTVESNALNMHALMLSSWPPISYALPATVAWMHEIWAKRASGMAVYFTQDAGPNLKLIFLRNEQQLIKEHFPAVEIVDLA